VSGSAARHPLLFHLPDARSCAHTGAQADARSYAHTGNLSNWWRRRPSVLDGATEGQEEEAAEAAAGVQPGREKETMKGCSVCLRR
jgi:hypothetical protein